MISPDKVDLMKLLPLFITGLVEKADPARVLAIMGCFELIEFNSTQALKPTIPLIIMPLKAALNLRDIDIVVLVCKFLQKLLFHHPELGTDLVPYYRQLLPVMNEMRLRNLTTYNEFEYS